MNVGSLEIQMAMDLARLREDLSTVKRDVGDAMGFVNGAVDIAKKAFVGFVSVASIDAFKNMVMGAINATGALHDMAQQTGNSVAMLGQMRQIGATSETSLESIAAASLKLSKNLALTDEEGKGAALALKAMGIDFDTFVKMNPDQRLLTTAKTLAQFEDGADKSAAAMLLMGKEGAKMLPFMADLAEQSEGLTAKLTEQEIATKALQASMADAFGDNLTTIGKNSEVWKKELSLGLLPALYEASEALVQMDKGAGGLSSQISQLAKDGTLAEWARGAMTAISYVLDIVQGLVGGFQIALRLITSGTAAMTELLGGLGNALKLTIEGEYSQALEAAKGGVRGYATIMTEAAEDVSQIWNQKLIGETFRDTMASLKGVQTEGKEARKQLDLSKELKAMEAAKKAEAEATKKAEAEQKKHTAAVQAAQKAGLDFVRSLTLKNDQLELELELGRKLTPVELENLKLTRDLESGKIRLSRADEAAARAAIEHGTALERNIAWMVESHKANLAAIDATDKRIESIRDETEKQREANGELLLATEQLGEVRRAKLLDLAASADRKAALMDEIDWTGQLGDQQRELAQAYRDSASVAAEGAAVKAAKEAQDAWQKTTDSIGQGLTDSLFRAFESGQGFFDTLWKGIVNTFKTTALKLIISGGDGKGGIVGTVMDAIGMGSGGSSSSSAGGMGGSLSSLASWASLGKSVYGWLGGGSAAAGAGFGTVAYANAVGAVGGDSLGALIASNAGNWGVSVGAGAGASSGAGAGAAAGMGASASTSWIPIVGAIIAGMTASSAAFSQGYNQYNMPDNVDIWAPQHRWDTNLASKIVGDKWANMFSGASLTSKLLQWGAGTPHRGGMYVSDGTTGYVPGANYVGNMAAGDSVGKNRSQEIEDALKAMTGGAAGILNEFAKMFGGTGGYKVGAYFASDNSDPSQGNTKIWKGMQELASSADYYADNANEGYAEFTKALAAQVRQVMNTVDLPDWVDTELKGLTASATFEQIGKFIAGIEAIQKTLKDTDEAFAPLGGVFTRIADLSDDATIQLIKFAGGIDALMAKTASFVELYYTDGEKNAIAAADLLKQFTEAGITSAGALASKDDFRALVMNADVQTEANQKQLLALLDLGEAFAPVGEYLKEQGLTLAQLAEQAPQMAALQALNESSASTLEVQQQNADRLVQLDDTFNQVGEDLGAKLQSLTASVEAGLAAVAANTAETNRRFERWENETGTGVIATPA